jgi:hypothetical protein
MIAISINDCTPEFALVQADFTGHFLAIEKIPFGMLGGDIMAGMKTIAALSSVMADLKSKGSEKTRKIYANHGMPAERSFGVSNADLKVIAKSIKGQQALACELFATGNVDAMYLAGLVADGAKMSAAELQSWAEGAAGLSMIAEYSVPWVTVESAHAWEMPARWIETGMEPGPGNLATSGWTTYSGLVATVEDQALDLALIEGLLSRVVQEIHSTQNRVRYTMNGFVISVGSYVLPLATRAKAAAKEIGPVSVQMGNTACMVPAALEYIAKVETAGKAGKKRKTIRC